MRVYDPSDWYWLTKGGKVFSSKRVAFVDQDDPELTAFFEDGGFTTPWPKDTEGKQSVEALQEVLGEIASLEGFTIDASGEPVVST
jgi:hypothetical protein